MSSTLFFSFSFKKARRYKLCKRLKGTRADRVNDPSMFHCAYTRKPECVDVLLHSIQLKEPSSCDEFLTRGRPENKYHGYIKDILLQLFNKLALYYMSTLYNQ